MPSCTVFLQVTRRLQMVLNAAARLVVGTGEYDHITPALCDVLHWLPVPQRTEFKIAVLAFDCVRGTGSTYFKDVCVPVSDIAARSSFHSAECGDLFVPRTRTMKLSRRSFTVASGRLEFTTGSLTITTDKWKTVSGWA